MSQADAIVDVLIVGGGFAGLAAARAVAASGLSVRVLERKEVLGTPIRTSGASWTQSMRRLGVPPHLYHPVSVAKILAPEETCVLRGDPPPGAILHVDALLRWQAKTAEFLGAEIQTGIEIRGAENSGGIWTLSSRKGAQRGRFLIDASGMNGVLTRVLSTPRVTRFGLGAEFLLEAPDFDSDTIALWMGFPGLQAGYAWAFPEGDDRVRFGVGLIRPDHKASPRRVLEAFLEVGPETEALRGRKALETRVGAIPSQPFSGEIVGEGWLRVGDAAGQASPLLGEGIRYALELGDLAGETLAEAWQKERGPPTPAQLSPYPELYGYRYGRRFRFEHVLNRRLARASARGWAKAVAMLRELPQEAAIDLLAGEFRPRLLLALAKSSPGTLWKLAKDLIASKAPGRRAHVGESRSQETAR